MNKYRNVIVIITIVAIILPSFPVYATELGEVEDTVTDAIGLDLIESDTKHAYDANLYDNEEYEDLALDDDKVLVMAGRSTASGRYKISVSRPCKVLFMLSASRSTAIGSLKNSSYETIWAWQVRCDDSTNTSSYETDLGIGTYYFTLIGTLATDQTIGLVSIKPVVTRYLDEEEKEKEVSLSENKPTKPITVIVGNYQITYNSSIPFYGKKPYLGNFGTISVSPNNSQGGNTEFLVNKVKINKKKRTIQITSVQSLPKSESKQIKKATKGYSGLGYSVYPYWVKDKDDIIVKMNKNNTDVKSVKIKLNNKYYKVKRNEFHYDAGNKKIVFAGENLTGSYSIK